MFLLQDLLWLIFNVKYNITFPSVVKFDVIEHYTRFHLTRQT